MDKSSELEPLLAKGKLDQAIALAESWWGQAPSVEERIPHLRDFLLKEYHECLEPAPCRLVYLNFDDPSETLREPGNLTVWVELYEKTPDEEEMDQFAGGGARYPLPVVQLELAELTVLYGMRMALKVMQQLRAEEHPLGSAEFRVGFHSGDDYTLLKKIRPFPCKFDFGARLQEVRSCLDRGERHRAMSLLQRMPGNLKKPQRAECERLETAIKSHAEGAQTLPEIEQALHDLSLLWSGNALIRSLRLRAAQLHLEAGQPLQALAQYYLVGQAPPPEALQTLDLPNAQAVKERSVATYLFADQLDPCTFGLAEIVGDRLERSQLTTLPLQVFQLLEQACRIFHPGDASETLTRAAFHAFQAGYGPHAAFLARKACEFNPENTTARRSLEALQAKGIQETGQERHCLESLMALKPMVVVALQAQGFTLS